MEWSKYIPLVLIAALTLLQIYIRFSARFMRGKPLPEMNGVIDESLLKRDKLVIYFSSEYCQPCKAMMPMITRLLSQQDNLIKLDALEHSELATRLHARGAPAFVCIERGQITDVHLGVFSEKKLLRHLT